MNIRFDNSYAQLPDRFYARLEPTQVRSPKIVLLNRQLAMELDIDPDWLASDDGLSVLSGNKVPDGADPLAQAYAGHQFGGFVPQLGDGRAILLGEVISRDGIRMDLQLKGSGPTPYSRGGDGRAWLGPVLREYIVSEAMHGLGIPTTRALASVTTGEPVIREMVLPGAILTRVASSHIRVGTFQFLAARRDEDGLALLVDHALQRHFPDRLDSDSPALAFLHAVCEVQARLVSEWMRVGFIHGVMNTDNMLVSGETIDYGPCAFMDSYHPQTVYSSIDRQGRYAFVNQPAIAQWNLAQLASALLPLIASDEKEAVRRAQDAVDGFADRFNSDMAAVFRRKLGFSQVLDDDDALAQSLLTAMAQNQVDHTNLFRALSSLPSRGGPETDFAARDLFIDPTQFDLWARDWRLRLEKEEQNDCERIAGMLLANPEVIPRNHRIEQVIKASLEGDFKPLHTLCAALSDPYEDNPERQPYRAPPDENEVVQATFCGT